MSRQRPRRSWRAARVEERGELVDRASDRPAGAGGVLQQQPGRVRAELESFLQRRHAPFHADFDARAEMRADVEDDAVGVDRAGDLHRVAQCGARLLVDLVVGRSEVDEIERVREHAAGCDTELRAALLERSKLAGSWFVGRHMRGLCVNSCTASAPIASARSSVVWMPPEADTWAPKNTQLR